MVKQLTQTRFWLVGGLVLVSLLIWLVLMHEFRLDDSFITYRYARNLARGWGLVYNHNEVVLSTTAPLYAVLLALLSFIIADFHVLGGLLGAIFIGVGAGLLIYLLPKTMPLSIRVWAALAYVLSSPLWLALGMETPLWIALVLAAVLLAHIIHYGLSGFLIGLAILTRPDAALPGALLGIVVLNISLTAQGTTRRWWLPLVSYALSAGVPVLLFFVWAWATYGSPFPATLSAKGAQAVLGITGFGVFVDVWGGLRSILENLVAQSLLYVVFALLMLFGISRRLSTPVLFVSAWGILHLVAYLLIGVAPYRWYYIPLLPGALLLAAYGLGRISRAKLLGGFAPATATVLAILPFAAQWTSFSQIASYFEQGGERQTMLPIVDWKAYREAGEWLNINTPPDATVGVAEVGQVGFYADRYMTDYLGLLQPDVAALVRRGDLYSWLVEYAPDYLVFQRFQGKVGLALYNYFIEYDLWFNANYREVAKFDDPRYILGPVVIYRRILRKNPLAKVRPLNADFGPARLVGIMTDVQDSKSGAVRVRLDWQVTGELPTSLHIAVAVMDAPDEIKFDGDYQTDHWPERLSTWHTLIIPENLSSGQYPLSVSIGMINGAYVPQSAGNLTVPSGEDDDP